MLPNVITVTFIEIMVMKEIYIRTVLCLLLFYFVTLSRMIPKYVRKVQKVTPLLHAILHIPSIRGYFQLSLFVCRFIFKYISIDTVTSLFHSNALVNKYMVNFCLVYLLLLINYMYMPVNRGEDNVHICL